MLEEEEVVVVLVVVVVDVEVDLKARGRCKAGDLMQLEAERTMVPEQISQLNSKLGASAKMGYVRCLL